MDNMYLVVSPRRQQHKLPCGCINKCSCNKSCGCVGKCKCKNKKSEGFQIYMVFHIIMTCVAVYLSNKCNKGYDMVSFLIAVFFPYIYIIYILASRGVCEI